MLKPIFLMMLSLGSSQGAILFVDFPDIELLSGGGFSLTRDFDLNDNTVDDVRFISDQNSIRVESLNANTRIAMVISPPPDMGGVTVAFAGNSPIGSILRAGESWSDAGGSAGNSTLIACRNIGCIGQFGSGLNYVGVELTDEDGDKRYGWFELNIPIPSQSGTINSFAFETNANTPILAGAVPEPSSLVLSLLGLAALMRRKR